MASKNLFRSIRGKLLPRTNCRNDANAPAYGLPPEHALAQFAVTGCLNSTFYATDRQQLDKVLALCDRVEPETIAKVALYARREGRMKEMPALLCAALSVRDLDLMERIFFKVLDNARMLRNFVQIVRSGQVGRKSLGSRPKRLIRRWLEQRGDDALFRDSIGQNPSMTDIVKMVHPKPANRQREALYGFLLGRPVESDRLPPLVRHYLEYREGTRSDLPDVPFRKLTSLPLGTEEWFALASHAPWHMLRMNLNTFARHGVFESDEAVDMVARRLRDPGRITRAGAFPHQIMVAWRSADGKVPSRILDALEEAMEISLAGVPRIEGKVYICPDVSGSMTWSSLTGYRKGATSVIRCIDLAALYAAAILRSNREAEVIPFEQGVVPVRLLPRDTVMTNADRLAAVGGGGTNVSAPLRMLNRKKARGDLVVFLSDNESWVDADASSGTALMAEWNEFKIRNPRAWLVCVDIQPDDTTQAKEREDILNIGGFSDSVFDLIALFAQGKLTAEHWAGVVGAVEV